jgi:hypothetical protein
MEKNKQNKTQIIDMDSIPEIEIKKIDVTKYVGLTAKIEIANVILTKFGRAIKFTTEIIGIEGTEKKPINLRASKLLNLQQDDDGCWGINKDSNTYEFFKAWNLKNYKDMIGKTVTLISYENKNGVNFLTFV